VRHAPNDLAGKDYRTSAMHAHERGPALRDEFPTAADIVIVGGGIHGVSLAYHLARKGAGRVALLEKQFLASGPTGRSTGLVRRWSGQDFLTRTGNRATDIFRNWSEVIGGDCGYHEVGFLAIADETGAPALRETVRRARELGSRIQLVGPRELGTLVPEMAVDDLALAAWEPDSGFVDASLATTTLAKRARDYGATIVQRAPVAEIVATDHRVTGVRTEGGEIAAPVVVNCAGVWADRLLAPLGIDVPLAPTRHQVSFFVRPAAFASHPAIADLTNQTYLRPDVGNLTIFGLLVYDEVVNPDGYNEGVDPDEIVGNAERIARRFPIMQDGLSRGGYSGLYDITPDHEPVLGAIPEYTGLYANFGWSGHGFKHAPVIGDILSDVILDGRSAEFDLTPFRWTRFREGESLAARGIL
jgi:sarcosine oxidase, subunit beta